MFSPRRRGDAEKSKSVSGNGQEEGLLAFKRQNQIFIRSQKVHKEKVSQILNLEVLRVFVTPCEKALKVSIFERV